MHWAAYARDPARTANFLIEAGAKVNKTDKSGQTPLHTLAIRPGYGKSDLARCFVQNGAKIDIKDDNGNTPIELAEMEGEEEVYRVLKDKASSWW
jgi:ankyrin repeat protein